MISNLFWIRPRTNKTYIFTKFYNSKLFLFVNLLKLTSYIYMAIILFFRSFCIAGSPKCNKDFPGGFGEKVYSEFDVENNRGRGGGWSKNKPSTQSANAWDCFCKQPWDQQKLESKPGERISVIAFLSYYDTTRRTVINPMHNLSLGKAKPIWKIWKNWGIWMKIN